MKARTKCEIFSRVQGYYRPVERFNVGKKGEFNQRVFFTNEKAENCCRYNIEEQKVA